MVGVRYVQVSGRGMKPRPPTATPQFWIVRFENGEQHETHLRRSCRPVQRACANGGLRAICDEREVISPTNFGSSTGTGGTPPEETEVRPCDRPIAP